MNHMSEVEGLAVVFLDLFGHNHLAIEADCQPPRGQLGMDVSRESRGIQPVLLSAFLSAEWKRERKQGVHITTVT